MKPILFNLFAPSILYENLSTNLAVEKGDLALHTFPDGESLIRFITPVDHRDVIFLTSLDHPNEKLLPLIFAAQTAKEQGAKHITLVTPYLPYMRQDKVFQKGEGITSKYFARLLSHAFDLLITIDPHLHRWHSLDDIYSIPSKVLHATELIAQWIQTHVESPLIIGPDRESEQWVKDIATFAKIPFIVLDKIREGDFSVNITSPEARDLKAHTPLLIDDIISTGKTMVETLHHLKRLNSKPPICIAIHALFTGNAYHDIQKAGAARIITCNSVEHMSNDIDISPLIAEELNNFCHSRESGNPVKTIT